MIHNHFAELCLASGCESWCAMLSQLLWIMVRYAEPVVANHVVLCWVSGYESLCVMLSQWLWIIVSYAEPVVVNHDYTLWLTPTGSAKLTMTHNHLLTTHIMIHNQLLRITPHDSQSLAQDYTPSGCESWCAMMCQWVWIMVCYAEPVVVNHGLLCCTKGCELWRLILSQ
jgi:hypothetical protein